MGALLCAGAAAPPSHPEDGKKKDVPLYTDEDLRRVSPLRDQTGGSTPAAPPPAPAAATEESPGAGRARARFTRARAREVRGARGVRAPQLNDDASYWRRESERLQDRLQPLRERIEELRVQIEERRRSPRVRPYSDPRIESWQRRLAALEQRIREAEDRLHERARREGALPGWLR